MNRSYREALDITHPMGAAMEYPHYDVEGRRFADKSYGLAVHFARDLANRMGRPVPLLQTLDHMTPAAVIFTAAPDVEEPA